MSERMRNLISGFLRLICPHLSVLHLLRDSEIFSMLALSCHVGTTVRFFLNLGKMKIFLARTCLLTKQRCAKTRGGLRCAVTMLRAFMKYVFRLAICSLHQTHRAAIVWETDRVAAFAIPVAHGLRSIVTLCLLIR